jgi:hypothetical protein
MPQGQAAKNPKNRSLVSYLDYLQGGEFVDGEMAFVGHAEVEIL